MLYDRLVVPVPANEKEWKRWERADLDWQPAWQQQVLSAIKAYEQKHNLELVLQVPWNDHRRHAFNDTITKARAAGFEIDGYKWTAGQLLSDQDVRRAAAAGGVKPRVIAAYVSRNAFEEEVLVEEIAADELDAQPAGPQQLAFAVGRRFLAPDVDGESSEERDLEVVQRVARLVTKTSFRTKRAAYNDWVDRVVRDGLTTKEAVSEMDRRLREYEVVVRAEKIATRIEQAFLVTGVALGVAGHFFPPIWIGNVMLAPARYIIGREFGVTASSSDPAAMFHEARTELRLAPSR